MRRLKSSSGSDKDVTFSIDALGRQGGRTIDGTTTIYAYLGTSAQVSSSATSGSPITLASYSAIAPSRYQGRILQSADGATDLYDFGARSYDPSLASFISFDTGAVGRDGR